MRQLFVSDMDGTLLDNSARVDDVSRRTLRNAIAAGALFTVATARTAATVQPLMCDVGMTLPAIVMTGAALWHFDTKRYNNVRYIPGNVAAQIDRAFADAGLCPFVYVLPPASNILHVYKGDDGTASVVDAEFIAQRNNLPLKVFHLSTLPPAHTAGMRVLYFAMGNSAAIDGAASALRNTPCSLSVYGDTYHRNTSIIEVFAPGVSKARAVLDLKNSVGADTVCVFGDNLNDLSMFDVADTSVAVSNAANAVCARADVIIGRNTDAAVPRYVLAQVQRRRQRPSAQ